MKNKSSIIKDALALCLITLVASLSLGFVNEITKGPIAQAKAKEKAVAYKTVFKEATLVDDTNADINQAVADSEQFLTEKGLLQVVIDEVCIAKDDSGKALGFVMSLTSKAGFNPPIRFSLGIKADGTVTGLEVLECSETAGYGDNVNREDYRAQYVNKKVEQFELVGANDAAVDNQINAISGATITSKATINTVNAGVAFANHLVESGIGGVGVE